MTEGIRAGRVGALLNLWGADETRAVQRLAVEESRLGIPLLLGLDVVHGHRTIFPVPLAEACLFDPVLWEETARAAAEEATMDGVAMTFAPMLDVARDPRWGRIVEGPGEDPWVASEFAAAKTRGFQGHDLSAADSLAATAKHLGAYGAVTAGREYASADLSERTLHEIYLPAFAAAVAAGTAAIMPAFNDIAGAPTTANAALLQGWLRGRLGFDGVLVSDYNAIAELLDHGVAGDIAEAAALALKAGVDIDMMSDAYAKGPAGGAATRSCRHGRDRRQRAARARAQRASRPFRRSVSARRGRLSRDGARGVAPAQPGARDRTASDRAAHQRAGRVAPFSRTYGASRSSARWPRRGDEMLGPWASAGRGEEAVSILEGLAAALPNCRIDHAAGVDIAGDDTRGIAAALDLCRDAEAVVLCLGEAASMSGEAASRADLGLPGRQRALAEAVLDLGKPVVALLSSGRPLALPWLFERADAVLAAWFLGGEAGHAVADVLTGKFNPTGKLPVTWPRYVGQAPIFYGQRPSGRPTKAGERYSSSYLDLPAAPQFPFGHGLSYSRFALHDLRCNPTRVKAGETVEISVTVA